MIDSEGDRRKLGNTAAARSTVAMLSALSFDVEYPVKVAYREGLASPASSLVVENLW